MDLGVERIERFNGVARDVHRARLPADLFQVDQNSDRFEAGTWRPRRGYVHTTVPELNGPITSLMGFAIPGGEFGLLVISGTEAHGFTGVSAAAGGADEGDYGEGGEGEGGFGA